MMGGIIFKPCAPVAERRDLWSSGDFLVFISYSTNLIPPVWNPSLARNTASLAVLPSLVHVSSYLYNGRATLFYKIHS